ncbi:2428_t:CDS:10 [Ambispora gerdemannii]|uniref:2428_t:CDS:1 n=1 Tax=Ambispora gerdemannii TaxID=144530 RepID=A0A9N9AJ35_9GLOM|nr:2428_t:CDS:10 [Ambispora gerdemannii]
MQQNGDSNYSACTNTKSQIKNKEKILDGPIGNGKTVVHVETTISTAAGNLSSPYSATTALSKFLEENNDRGGSAVAGCSRNNNNIKSSANQGNANSYKGPGHGQEQDLSNHVVVGEIRVNNKKRLDERINNTNKNNNVRENVKFDQEKTQYADIERADREFRTQVFLVHTLICVMCFLIGRYGFSVVLIWIFISQFNSWYNSRTRDTKQRISWYIQRELGYERLRNGDGETVEWLNYIIQQIWSTFNPELLVSITDMLEDAMTRSAPSFVTAAVIESLELGIVAPRIDNITILGQRETEDGDETLIGEASFSFISSTDKNSSAAEVAPPHIIASIKTGLKAYIPVKVEIIGFSGTIRFEIQATGTPPFVSRGKFSLVNAPTYETSIVSLVPINLAQLPILKNFLKTSVNTALHTVTYPSSTDVDLAELLSGDDVKHDTSSIGVVKIDIYEAKDLAKVDLTGDNDPYVVSALEPSPYIHSEITSRIIENDPHPIWNEQHFHKIPEIDVLSEHVKLRLSVWDWDRFSPDDHIGSAWFDLIGTIGDGKEEKLVFDGWTDLFLNNDRRTKRGCLRCRILFSPKLPKDAVPKKEQTSGILGIQIQQAMSLQVTAAPYTQPSSTIPLLDHLTGTTFPNPYAVVFLNDTQVYRTRVKLNNVAPYWNACTEQFVRDWSTATLRILIKNQRDLEYDPVIGIVTVSLKELFESKHRKDVTKWFPLRDGVGCGKVRLSFLFKPVTLKLLPTEKGYDVGTLEVKNIKAVELDRYHTSRHYYVTLELNISHTHSHATEYSSAKPPSWSDVVLFPIFERYKRCLSFKIKRQNFLGIAKTVGIAEIWLRDLIDLEEKNIELPIYEKSLTAHQKLLAQQGDISVSNQLQRGSPKIKGYLQFTIKLLPGLSPLHEKMLRRTLTGASAKVLEHNPAHDIDLIQEITNSNCRFDPDLVSERRYISETAVTEDRRINQFYESQTIRRIQWINDLVRARLSHLIGRHEWSEDLQVVEREA